MPQIYERLAFAQYFINNSGDWNSTGRMTRQIKYESVEYYCNFLEKLLGMKHEMNYEMYYDSDRDVIEINFQKTNGKMDWFSNIFEFSSKYYEAFEYKNEKLQLKAHHGWSMMYKSVKGEIRGKWQKLHDEHNTATTEIIGWSLGSGQAMLCAQDLNFNFHIKPYLYTYGSVKPFASTKKQRGLLKEYLEGVCAKAYNFANINDIVTYMPPFKNFQMINLMEVGQEESKTLKRLLNPNRYHTIYDQDELYTQYNSKEKSE